MFAQGFIHLVGTLFPYDQIAKEQTARPVRAGAQAPHSLDAQNCSFIHLFKIFPKGAGVSRKCSV